MREGGDGLFSFESLATTEIVRRVQGLIPSVSAVRSLECLAASIPRVAELLKTVAETEANTVQAKLIADKTSSDVAHELGVSRVAVLEIVNGMPALEVSEEIRLKAKERYLTYKALNAEVVKDQLDRAQAFGRCRPGFKAAEAIERDALAEAVRVITLDKRADQYADSFVEPVLIGLSG